MTRRPFQLLVPWIPPAVWLAGVGILSALGPRGPDSFVWLGLTLGQALLMWLAFWTAFSRRHWAIRLPGALLLLSIGLVTADPVMEPDRNYPPAIARLIEALLVFAPAFLAATGLMRWVRSSAYELVGDVQAPPTLRVGAKFNLIDLFALTALFAITAGLIRSVFDFSDGFFSVGADNFIVVPISAVVGVPFAIGAVLCAFAILGDPPHRSVQIAAFLVEFVQSVILLAMSRGMGHPTKRDIVLALVFVPALPIIFCICLLLARAAGYRLVPYKGKPASHEGQPAATLPTS